MSPGPLVIPENSQSFFSQCLKIIVQYINDIIMGGYHTLCLCPPHPLSTSSNIGEKHRLVEFMITMISSVILKDAVAYSK